MVELSQVKIWKFGFLRLTSFAETWCEMWDHVFKKSTSGNVVKNLLPSACIRSPSYPTSTLTYTETAVERQEGNGPLDLRATGMRL